MAADIKKSTKEPKIHNNFAIAGFVLSLCGLFTGITFVIGLVLSAVGLSQIKKTGQAGRGMALAGTIIGAIGTALSILASIVVVAVMLVVITNISHNVMDGAYDYYKDTCGFNYTYNEQTQEFEYNKVLCD